MSTPDHPSWKKALAEAAERSGKYEWMAAADLYKRALDGIGPKHDTLEAARVSELLAKSYFKGAFQSENKEEFKRVMLLAEHSYQRAADLHERAGSNTFSKRSKARSQFAKFWLQEDAAGRRNIIAQCISIVEEAKLSGDRRDKRSFAEAQRDLLAYFSESIWLAVEWESLKEQFERAVETGEKAVGEFEVLEDNEGVLESLHLVLRIISYWFDAVLEPSEVRAIVAKAEKLVRRIVEVSKLLGTPYALCLANGAAGPANRIIPEKDSFKTLSLLRVAASEAEKTGDSRLTGLSQADFGSSAEEVAWGEEDAKPRREVLEETIRRLSTARNNFEVSSDGACLGFVFDNWSNCYTLLAMFVDTETETKRAHLRKAIEIAKEGLAYKDYWAWSGYSLYKAMYFLSTLDIAGQEREQLLREALAIGEETVPISDRLYPNSWVNGSMRNYLAMVKAALSSIEKETSEKLQLLERAVSDMQQCVAIVAKWATTPTLISALAHYEEWYGDILLQLYHLTSESDTAQQSIHVYQETIAYLGKLEHIGSIAAVRWKLARVYDAMGDYKEASHAFGKAAEDYRLGAENVPGSASVFRELASYMDAWSLIENARLHHNEDQYQLAAERYEKAANILQHTREWTHLSKHYTACFFLEQGEATSRQENPDLALRAFSEAMNWFGRAKLDLETRIGLGLGSQEEQELRNWIRVSDGRERYCRGRVELEEAKLLDKKGDEEKSLRKYSSASEIFRELLTEAPNPQSRSEMETLTLFCEAWARMKRAEAEASPELYAKAAEAFMKAKEASTKKRFRLLGMANASICRALESGALFRGSRSTNLYSEIKRHLETATDYYHEAGFDNAADWTRGTQRLFDALAYLASAETEIDSKRKTQLYHLAEKHLQLAAKTYGEAGFPTKREEALKHLRRAREEKELLLTPIEALADSPAVTEVAVAPVSLTRDQAVGIERFEVANVVGNLSLHQKVLNVGSDLTLELEMANVGKTAATLVKLENIAPDGLELVRERIPHRVEDNYIDMKGKRLEHLKTHEVKVSMKALRKGAFELRPRILYVDEKGSYRSYEFEPAAITVMELGISGWLKGPSK